MQVSTPPQERRGVDEMRGPRWAVAFGWTAFAYFMAGMLALQLASPPSYAAPLFPAAGVALVSVLLYGPRMAGAAALGAYAVNLSLSASRGTLGAMEFIVPLGMAAGAALQAWVGAWLVRRFVRTPLLLAEARDIGMFFGLGAVAACTVNASLSNAILVAVGTVPASDLVLSWFTWWAGDALGTLIAAPIALTLLGRPRSEWRPRRITVGLPLAIVTALLALGIVLVTRLDAERQRRTFERDAINAASLIGAQLQEPLRALEAMRGVFLASQDVTRDELRRAAQAWLRTGRLQAIGWSERLRRSEIAAFEAREQASGLPAYRVFDRPDGLPQNGLAGELVVPVRYIEPLEPNIGALGVNSFSVPNARPAIESAWRSGLATASAGMKLTQDAPDDPGVGVVVYQAVYAGVPANAEERWVAATGVIFVTLRMDKLLESIRSQLPGYLLYCLVDDDGRGVPQRLAGQEDCHTAPHGNLLTQSRALDFAGRSWQIRVAADPRTVPDTSSGSAWLFSIVGLMATAMLGALLLTVTGRARRIETAVRDRTAELESMIKEREQAQAALRESEQRFRNILNTVPIGVIYTDLNGNVKQTNPRFRELVGYTEGELRSMDAAKYTHPEDVGADAELTRQLLSGEIPMARRQKRLVAKGGQTFWVQATTTLLKDASGRPRRIVGVVEDISEHLRLQEAENARELAEAANRAKSDFLSRMSHELRTPLNAMLGFAQLLELDQRHPLAENQKPWVGQIQQAGWHLLEMINDVLDLSRIESGNLRLQAEPLDLGEAISASVAMVDADAKRRALSISVNLAPDANTLLGDATRVKQILTNLLSNAVKYNKEGGRIQITSRASTMDSAEITVTDTGMGMTPQQLAELFQPFNRLGRERSALQGTGIGLVISKRLAELMGGTLRARSQVGEGTAFTLTLPRLSDPDTVPSDLQPIAETEAEYHERIVLYVEDNETNVEVMRGILAQRPQVRLEVALTGAEGLARLRQIQPDLVLLDMHLPDMHGLQLLREMRGDPIVSAIPVVVVSADALASQIDAALQAGATNYLTKPVGVNELLAVVDELLDSVETRYGTIN
jgi:PAS domain S-box-containing protein